MTGQRRFRLSAIIGCPGGTLAVFGCWPRPTTPGGAGNLAGRKYRTLADGSAGPARGVRQTGETAEQEMAEIARAWNNDRTTETTVGLGGRSTGSKAGSGAWSRSRRYSTLGAGDPEKTTGMDEAVPGQSRGTLHTRINSRRGCWAARSDFDNWPCSPWRTTGRIVADLFGEQSLFRQYSADLAKPSHRQVAGIALGEKGET